MRRKHLSRLVVAVVVAIIGALTTWLQTGGQQEDWHPGLDGQWVETTATVYRLLPDDNVGSRHQRFLVRAPNGHSLLIAHNIDLAPRVPLREHQSIEIRGMFEWNDKGGVIHWTHHDPQRRHNGGYIEAAGKQYR